MPTMIAPVAAQEDLDVIVLSILSGTHSTFAPRLMELLQKNGINDIIVLLGGTIPAIDIASLKKASIAEVFFPARPRKTSLIL